jgi:hypothetical protein
MDQQLPVGALFQIRQRNSRRGSAGRLLARTQL